MDVPTATRSYEDWLAARVGGPLDPADLAYKHGRMGDPDDPFPFLRGTYYLWARTWASAAGDLAAAPAVLAVGDLHAENFGTWRDADGRLCWGVNDFDEADALPYTNDLVRLATSVRLARRGGGPKVKTDPACDAILGGYRAALAAGGTPFVLEEHHPRLRALATAADRDPAAFWAKLTKVLNDPPAAPPPDATAALTESLPPGPLPHLRFRRRVGMGSLGRPRYVALAERAGGWVAREVKAAAPPATAWAAGRADASHRMGDAVGRAVRSADPYYRPGQRWVARRLGPRCSRVELSSLSDGGDVTAVLAAMGAEAANVHLGTPGAAAAVLADLDRRPAGWLAAAARAFGKAVEADWAAWRAAATARR